MRGRHNGNEACWRVLALILGTIVISIGCGPEALYFLIPGQDLEQPKMPLVKNKKKETTVVVLASFANPLETRPEFQTVDRELCEKLIATLKPRFDQNHEKVKIVPYHKVKSYLNKELDANVIPKRDIGQHFSADYVINLEITSMRFYKTGSYGQLFEGNAEIFITVFDVHSEDGEGPLYQDVYRIEYPSHGPIAAADMSVLQFRSLFMNRMSRELTRMLAAHPSDEKMKDFD